MEQIEKAVIYASQKHKDTYRKGLRQPYFFHPLEVLSLASLITDDDDILCAAVLHDTVEDTDATIEEIYSMFGNNVGHIVEEETENKRSGVDKSLSWRVRKQETIDHLSSTDCYGAKVVCLCDKTSNLRSMHMMLLQQGQDAWNAFNNKNPEDHYWYYDSIRKCLSELQGTPVYKEYSFLIDTIFNHQGEK